MEVFADALRHNFEVVRFLVGRKRDILAVIKADAYGHGAVRAAGIYRELGCGHFAVARLCEALELREAGITEDILILGQEPESSAKAVVEYGLTCTCAELSFARELSREAASRGRRAKVHIKVNTGMGRLGFLPEDMGRAAEELFSLPGLGVHPFRRRRRGEARLHRHAVRAAREGPVAPGG